MRERHFECFIRSKELELLLARYRESEVRQRVEAVRARADKLDEEVRIVPLIISIMVTDSCWLQSERLRKDLEEAHNGQTLLIEKLIQCCKEVRITQCNVRVSLVDYLFCKPNAERTQRLFTSLREELEKRGTKLADGPVGG